MTGPGTGPAPRPGHGISGTTRLYAVLGDPVAQVRAPGLLNALFARTGTDAVLVPLHVTPADLATVLRGLRALRNLDGVLVTVPHKIEVCRYADELAPAARLAGSANALRRNPDGTWRADNFDGAGFVHALRAHGHDPAGAEVALFGAGGAGRALACALLTSGVRRLHLFDPDATHREDLLTRLTELRPGWAREGTDEALARVDLAVNASPLGMRPGDPLPFAPDRLPPHGTVADLVMKPAETALLRAAAAAGRPVVPGGPVLDSQVALYRDFFGLTGDAPPEGGPTP
ncbi:MULTISPECIES: shikimate dehydrogenase family protein [unclassified Streptomyces]|uniref:shikimate dehydrogenase family protein n=1 Tax=unclassified Streptomyces TaxID=2593676 RepID=UPI00380E313A